MGKIMVTSLLHYITCFIVTSNDYVKYEKRVTVLPTAVIVYMENIGFVYPVGRWW